MATIEEIQVRQIQSTDNPSLADLIRHTLAEFGANKPGTVYFDPTTDHLFEEFSKAPRSVYYVAETGGKLIGGAGIFPSPGLPDDTCELVKMYLYPEARGIGLGKLLIDKALAFAKDAGYKQVYLETMPELKQALNVYAKYGFEYIKHPMGNTGHHGCDLYMLKRLVD